MYQKEAMNQKYIPDFKRIGLISISFVTFGDQSHISLRWRWESPKIAKLIYIDFRKNELNTSDSSPSSMPLVHNTARSIHCNALYCTEIYRWYYASIRCFHRFACIKECFWLQCFEMSLKKNTFDILRSFFKSDKRGSLWPNICTAYESNS